MDQLGIYVVPLKVIFGTEEYRDGVDIKTKQFYQRLSAGELSMSSPPAPFDFLQVYEKSIAAGESIISIHISAQLSATLNSARTAKNASGYEDITIIDSLSASAGLGLMVVAAARAANEGKSKEEIINLVKTIREKMKMYFIVDTLEFLIRGGRISRIEGFVGSLLHIKPILTLKDGVILPYAKTMGKSRALEKLLDIIAEDAGKAGDNIVFSLTHGDDNAALNYLDQKIQTKLHNPEKAMNSETGPVIGTHAGPRTVGVAYYTI